MNLDEIIAWIIKDIQQENPIIAHSLFSGKELVTAVGELNLNLGQIQELLRALELAHAISRTNKVGPDGEYYNIHRRMFIQHSLSRTNKDFIRQLNAPDEGFCHIITPNKTYRLECAGRKCKFFLASEKQCVLKKFFLE